jgi:hypothetical protein
MRELVQVHLVSLEHMAPWEKKLPAILRGELRPAKGRELLELAEYCAGFEKKYVLAARFATEAFAADPKQYGHWTKVSQLAGLVVRAAAEKGGDAAALSVDERSQLRREALRWLREATPREDKAMLLSFGWSLRSNPNLAACREPVALAELPPDERADWKRFWDELPQLPK